MRLFTMGSMSLVLICSMLLPGRTAADERAPGLEANRIEISYVQPKNPQHMALYDLLKERRVLERFQGYLSPVRLPKVLTLRTEGCDGDSNAWYDEKDHSVAVCYEYLKEVQENAPAKTTEGGTTPKDAVLGPVYEVFLHETSHALFDLLKVPLLGREEDAADLLAAYLLLNLDKDVARQTVSGVVFMYNKEAREQNPELEEFADVHGVSAQRLYNLLCLAYGSDKQLFGDVVEKGYLPKSRAESCAGEYRQIAYAYDKLLKPYIDETVSRKVQPKKLLRPGYSR